MNRLSLVQQFALRSLVFVFVMALALGLTISYAVKSMFEREAVSTARVTANAIVRDQITEADLNMTSAPPRVRDSLDSHVNGELADAGIVTVKLWNREGTLVYASDGQNVGRNFGDHAPLREALSGNVGVEVASEAEANEENEAQVAANGKMLEVYAPLQSQGGRIIGAFEIYQLYAPIEQATNEVIAMVWIIILLGSVPAYFLQLTLVNRTAKELTAAKGDLLEVNNRLEHSLDDLEMHSLGTLQALVAAVDAKDSYTARHSIAVTDYAVAIAKRLELGEREIQDVERAGLLHDVGKIGTPEGILLKPEKLDDAEFLIITEHSEMGGHIIESVPFLAGLTPIVRGHHERWDGRGYPDGLAGERIPLLARVLGVADAFDAMTSERPYRTPVAIEVARAELVRCAGSQFDPRIVQAMLSALDAGDAKVVVHTEAKGRKRRTTAAV